MVPAEFARFYSGTSGLQLPFPKYLFPPPFQDASRLSFYSTLFNSIEINSSFYKIPQPATVTRWMNAVSEKFKFTFKLYKGITHVPQLNFKSQDVKQFMEAIASAENKSGCLLVQFPPGLGSEFAGNLKSLLECIVHYNPNKFWNVAVEFRNKSWYKNAVYDMLAAYNAGIVIHDIPKSATPLIQRHADFVYVRFHGPTGNYRDSYADSFLSEYAGYVKEWLNENKTVYLYFNNTAGDALNNLQSLNRLVTD